MTVDEQGRELHDVVCMECGEDCQVPFKPIEGKKIKCMECWSRTKRHNNGKGSLGKVNGVEFEINKPKGAVYFITKNTGDAIPSEEEYGVNDIMTREDLNSYNEEDDVDEYGWF